MPHPNRALLAFALCASTVGQGANRDGPPPDRSAAVLADLRDPKVEVRRAAAIKLRSADAEAHRNALPVLIELLMKEKDGQVRLAVLDTVTALGPDARSAVPALVQTMRTNYGGQGQEESHQDYRSAMALAAIGKPAVEGLRSLLKERKENVRAEAIMGLGRIGSEAGAAVDDLIPLLGDKSERIGREASVALGRIGADAIDPLIAASSAPEAKVRIRAIESLGRLASPDDKVRRVVLDGSHDPDPGVRAEALRSMGHTRCPDEVLRPVLIENFRSRDERVRRAVVDVIVERRAILPSLSTELESLLTAEDADVSRLAAFLLAKLGPDAAARLIEALARKGSHVDQIAEALATIGRPILGRLKQALIDPEPRVRRGAALALGQVRPAPSGIVPDLVAGLADPDPSVRADFLAAIGHLGPRGGEAVPAVRTLLKDKTAEIRLRVIEILGRSAPRDDRLVDDLEGRLHDDDPRVQARSIDLLRSLGPPGRRSLPTVIDLLGDSDPVVRRSAVEFLESHGQEAAEAVPALGQLLADPDPKIRMIAAQTLGKVGPAARPAFVSIASMLGDDHADVREVAAFTLGTLELDAETLRPALAKALRDEKIEVRRAAIKSIQRLGPTGSIFVPDLIAMASSKENQKLVDRALRPFERGGPDARSLSDLIKQLDHDQVAVRLLAIKFLGLAGKQASEAIPALERICDDPILEIRQRARTACDQIKNAGTSGRDETRIQP